MLIAIFKSFCKKKQIQIKLVVTSMIFHYSELHLSKYKGLSAVSIKQNTHFNFQPVSMSVFLVLKNDLLKLFILSKPVFMAPR
jgi:hypothetical protein